LGPDSCLDLCNDPNPLNILPELGWECSLGTCQEDCGDLIYVGSEQCEDGNQDDFDGCSSRCLFEAGWTSTYDPVTGLYSFVPINDDGL